MTKKSSKCVKKNTWKRVSIDEAKVANVDYRYYDWGRAGYIEDGGMLVHVKVSEVIFDLRNQAVRSVLSDAKGNQYVRDNDYKMYESLQNFQAGISKRTDIHTADWFLLHGKLRECCAKLCDVDDEKGTSNTYVEVWIFENGKAENVPLEINAVSLTENGWSVSDRSLPEHFWCSREKAYYFNEYDVIDEDGDRFTERGVGIRLSLTKEQEKFLTAFEIAYDSAKNVGIRFLWDRDGCGGLVAFNGKEVEQLDYEPQHISCGDIIPLKDLDFCFHDTGILFYDYHGCESSDAIELKPTERQIKQWKKSLSENS